MSGPGGISLHAVDVSTGRPAEGLAVRLLRIIDGGDQLIAAGVCGKSGAFDHPSVRGVGISAGIHAAEFDVSEYFTAQGTDLANPAFLGTVRFQFGVANPSQHFHLPFKFTAWGYSLFRGGL